MGNKREIDHPESHASTRQKIRKALDNERESVARLGMRNTRDVRHAPNQASPLARVFRHLSRARHASGMSTRWRLKRGRMSHRPRDYILAVLVRTFSPRRRARGDARHHRLLATWRRERETDRSCLRLGTWRHRGGSRSRELSFGTHFLDEHVDLWGIAFFNWDSQDLRNLRSLKVSVDFGITKFNILFFTSLE